MSVRGGSGGGGTFEVPNQSGNQPQHRSRAARLSPLCSTKNNVGFTMAWTYDMCSVIWKQIADIIYVLSEDVIILDHRTCGQIAGAINRFDYSPFCKFYSVCDSQVFLYIVQNNYRAISNPPTGNVI